MSPANGSLAHSILFSIFAIAPVKNSGMTVLLCTLVFLFSPLSRSSVAAELASRMEARYRSAKTLQATFLERYIENGSVRRTLGMPAACIRCLSRQP
jgi:hypothetical protein